MQLFEGKYFYRKNSSNNLILVWSFEISREKVRCEFLVIRDLDFCPNGVPGVGKETVMQLFEGKYVF